MKSIVLILLSCSLFVSLSAGNDAIGKQAINENQAVNGKQVMLWMCLQRCGGTPATIASNLLQIAKYPDIIRAVSYEAYNLGPNSTLVINTDVSNVEPELRRLGVLRYPMVSTYPHPPEMVGWMRELWANPQPFTDACVKQIEMLQLDGINIDLEPANSDDFDAADGVAYAQWLQEFSSQIHQRTGAIVQVDVATWCPLWNLTLIGQTDVDQVETMSTYATSWTTFQTQFNYAMETIPMSKLSIGLLTTITNSTLLSQRFQMIQDNNISSIAIWTAPIPDSWFPFLHQFMNN